MAVPFLLTLTASARLAYPFIVAGVRRGLSGNAIERAIRAGGLSITRSTTLNPLMARLTAIDVHGRNLRFANKRFSINTNLLPEALTDIRRRFSYTYLIRGTNELGVAITRHVTVSTDSASITVGELDALARSAVVDATQSDALHDVTAVIDFGVQRAADFNI